MAYLNEFPNLKPNELNLNWILEQYSTFNDKLKELHDHFDSAINDINASIYEFESGINTEFNEFKNEVNTQIATINNAIEQVSDNVSEFVAEHMEEWQLDAITGENNDIIIGEYDPEEPITDGGKLNEIIINNVKFNTREFGYTNFTWFFNLTDSEIENGTSGGAKQFLSDIISGNPLYDYFTTCEELYGLDANNCIDYLFMCSYIPDEWGSSAMVNFASNQVVLSPIRVQKASNSYKMQISYATITHSHTANGLTWKVFPMFPY